MEEKGEGRVAVTSIRHPRMVLPSVARDRPDANGQLRYILSLVVPCRVCPPLQDGDRQAAGDGAERAGKLAAWAAGAAITGQQRPKLM